MKEIKSIHPLIFWLTALFFLHQIGQWGLGWSLPFLDSYLDPFLCTPLLLTGWLAEQRFWWERPSGRGLTLLEIAVFTVFIAFLSEGVYPRFSQSFTADWGDVGAFALGALLYAAVINPPPAGIYREPDVDDGR